MVNFPIIKKHLGEKWLEDAIKFLENQKRPKNLEDREIFSGARDFLLVEIEKNILKFEKLKGFDAWAKEARSSKRFKDCLFELMSMEIFIEKAESMELKKENGEVVPEAFIKNGDLRFFLESTMLEAIPSNIENKVGDLFKKSRKKFKGSEGIHLIGTFGFFDNEQKPKTELIYLKHHINKRFRGGGGKTIISFILTNFYIAFNPDKESYFMMKEYYLLPNPNKDKKYDVETLKKMIKVNEFRYLD